MGEKHRIRTDRFSLTLLPEEKRLLAQNAKKYGLSRTEYIRKLILTGGIIGKPMLDKEIAGKLICELECIADSVEQISISLSAGHTAGQPEWDAVTAAYLKLLDLMLHFPEILSDD